MTDWRNHIIINPDIQFGKPTITGTRIAVDLILEKLSEGETVEQILESHPKLQKEDVFACLSFATENLKNDVHYTIAQ